MKTGSGLILAILLLVLPFWAGFAMEGHGTAGAHACPLAPQAFCPPSIGLLGTFLFHAGHIHGLTLGILALFALFALAYSVLARREKLSLFLAACRNGLSSASDPHSASTRKFTRWLSLREHSPSFA